MRFVLTILGTLGLALGFLMFTTAHHPEHIAQATTAMLVGGIFLAAGLATFDIVEAIRNSKRG